MFTYEVNLVCDEERCSEMLGSSSHSDMEDCITEVVREAKARGWKREKTCWFCPDHVEKKWKEKK